MQHLPIDPNDNVLLVRTTAQTWPYLLSRVFLSLVTALNVWSANGHSTDSSVSWAVATFTFCVLIATYR